MKHYKYNQRLGLVDENGDQIIQMIAVGCSNKFLSMAGKELANKLNTIERGKVSAYKVKGE